MTFIQTLISLIVIGTAGLIARPAAADSLTLTLGGNTLRFPSANPDTTPQVPALENPMPISISYIGLGLWNVTVLTTGNLVSGSDQIPINRVHWTATGTGFSSGTLNSLIPQLIGAGAVTGTKNGTLNFFLDNSWSYPVGTYSQLMTITVIAL